jgi:hypothetical protein
VPAAAAGNDRLARTFARLKSFRRGRRLGEDLSVKALIEEGRR